ncbi:flagellar hook-basal body complex protein FliE [Celeribacter marinus]|uniref:flagellar hook-basal body complex protein FliE n=1 Tax=Celeribacter marinus TaxID=1397108 RepID=UPI003F6CD40D
MDIRSTIANQGYAATKPATSPRADPNAGMQGNSFVDATKSFAQTLSESEEIAKAALVGQADSQALVMALAQSELAVETVVTVRDKVVEAYQEILRMPV